MDAKRGKKYIQEFSKNMSVIGEPKIEPLSSSETEDYTKITFEPDLKKFKLSSLDDDMVALISKRVYDLAGTSASTVKVFLNNKRIS